MLLLLLKNHSFQFQKILCWTLPTAILWKLRIKENFKKIASNHQDDIGFDDFMKILKSCTFEKYSFLVNVSKQVSKFYFAIKNVKVRGLQLQKVSYTSL